MFHNDKRVKSLKRHTILGIYSPNNRVSKYVKQKLTKLKRKIDKSGIIIGDFHTTLLTGDRTTKQNHGGYE